ncbi:cyclopropane-fatty-acyl-phospholipid synthase family protein [Mesorhizobium sp. ZMM04-5]|uniref:Cyclopropane-fatty-acyl-phospholipid synthase family protein n=1 Tax=Mesorhizobium marinum TaxID=3228790 RepID=A0ABV3QYH6_9HYPH
MATRVPARIGWALERLALSGNETVLEIGCGRGIAASVVGAALRRGTITAIDRSKVAIDAAAATNAELAASDRATFHQASIETFAPGAARFDVIFAINVNVFWLNAGPALDSARRLLTDGGRLWLFYEPPSAGQGERIREALTAQFAENGFTSQFFGTTLGKVAQIGVTARPA